jgi:hypothetical protein
MGACGNARFGGRSLPGLPRSFEDECRRRRIRTVIVLADDTVIRGSPDD